MMKSDFRLGPRRAFPVIYRGVSEWRVEQLTKEVPGVRKLGLSSLAATYDAAIAIAPLLEVDPPTIDASPPKPTEFPGFDRYRASRLAAPGGLRHYQREDAARLATRAYSIYGNPPRTGKTPAVLAASLLLGAQRTLVICQAVARRGWGREIARWLDDSAVILRGRAQEDARIVCRTCLATGFVLDVKCPGCRGFGWRKLRDPAGAIADARWVIVNYDILHAQRRKTDAGKEYVDESLPGWASSLAQFRFDLALIDEGHLIRGWQPNATTVSRREHVAHVVEHIPVVIDITASPIVSFVSDLWGQLDTISGGCWGRGKPFTTHVRYCAGRKGDYGWQHDGVSNSAELKQRLSLLTVRRPLAEILPEMPPKIRLPIDVEQPSGFRPLARRRDGDERASKTSLAMRATAEVKVPALIETRVEDLLSTPLRPSRDNPPMKLICFAQRKDTARMLLEGFDKLSKSREHGRALRERNFMLWHFTGELSGDARSQMSERFSKHNGAGVAVATIDALQTAVNMTGARIVDFVELHSDPYLMVQAENRPYIVGETLGLTICYWRVVGTIDVRRHNAMQPKIEAVARIVEDADADGMARLDLMRRESIAADERTAEAYLDEIAAGVSETEIE